VAVKDGLHAPEAFAVQFHQDGEHRVALMAADRQRLRDQALGEPLGIIVVALWRRLLPARCGRCAERRCK